MIIYIENSVFFLFYFFGKKIALMPSHFFLQGVSFFTEDHYIHLFYFVSFLIVWSLLKLNIYNEKTVLNFEHLPYKNLGISECDLCFGSKVIAREKNLSLVWFQAKQQKKSKLWIKNYMSWHFSKFVLMFSVFLFIMPHFY